MLNVERLNCWLNSDETRLVIRNLNDTYEELRATITSGVLLQEQSAEKISLDYTYAMGQLNGLDMAIESIKDISSILDEQSEEERDGN